MSDLIDRQAAIEALKTDASFVMFDDHGNYTADGLRILEVLTALPSAQSEQQWIPCSERSPDMHDEVLVTARGEVSIAWLYVDGKWRSNDMPQPMLRDIIAWMPLPEPWKEGEADGNQH